MSEMKVLRWRGEVVTASQVVIVPIHDDHGVLLGLLTLDNPEVVRQLVDILNQLSVDAEGGVFASIPTIGNVEACLPAEDVRHPVGLPDSIVGLG